jgi:hypothetical protein
VLQLPSELLSFAGFFSPYVVTSFHNLISCKFTSSH